MLLKWQISAGKVSKLSNLKLYRCYNYYRNNKTEFIEVNNGV